MGQEINIRHVHTSTYAHFESLNTAVHWRGNDVILSAAKPAEEASEGGGDRRVRSRG